MTIDEFSTLAKTIGLPGAVIAFVTWFAARHGGSAVKETSRDDLMAEIKSMRKENADENRLIRKDIDALSKEVTDRLARVETTVSSHSRKLDR